MEKPNSSENQFLVSTFYKFVKLEPAEVETLKDKLEDFTSSLEIKGLFLLGTEGVNSTLAGTSEDLETFKDFLVNETRIGDLVFKDSWSYRIPFRLLKFQIRDEIVTIGDTNVLPVDTDTKTHVTPKEWHEAMERGEGVILDTRNWYETDIGTFKGAVIPEIETFTQFGDKAQNLVPDKETPIYMFCTGGIRCEKAAPELKRRGYKNVYQLEGGILNYMKEYPQGFWEGECFVFDHRVAVDKNLQPSKTYSLCPHCGQPAKDIIDCVRCDERAKVCTPCLEKAQFYKTCSKNCAHHTKLGSNVRVKKQSTNRQLWNK